MMNTDDYCSISTDDEVGVVINNLGGTSNLELAVMANDTIRYLGKLTITRNSHITSYYITSQWMLGK